MPLYGNALKRIRSGVLVPGRDVTSKGMAEAVLGEPRVVMRVACVVSALGGGGREASVGSEEMTAERQRKHSPLP